MHILRTSVTALLLATSLSAQAPSKAEKTLRDQLPPSAILDELLTPFEAVRADMGNWSDVELDALKVAVQTASVECTRLSRDPHEGEELYALARMCSTGQNWAFANSAGTRYVRDGKAAHLPQAYYIIVQAQLNMSNVDGAVEFLQQMEQKLPFSAETDAVFNYGLRILEVPQPEVGVRIALMRQPHLLDAAQQNSKAFPAGVAEAEAIHTLELLYFADHAPSEVKKHEDALKDAVARRASPLAPAQAYAAAVAHRRYEALGNPLPVIATTSSTYEVEPDPTAKKLRLFVIVPENCVNCGLLAKGVDVLRQKLNRTAEAWLVADASGLNAKKPGRPSARPAEPAEAVHQIVTSSALMDELGATAAPVFVVTDDKNNVQFVISGQAAWLPQDRGRQSIAEVIMDRVANARHQETAPGPAVRH